MNHYNTTMDGAMPVDIDDSGSPIVKMQVKNSVSASAMVNLIAGTASAFVITIQVSNDPDGIIFVNHPQGITLDASHLITEVFNVAGYLWVAAKLTTVNGSNARAHVYLNGSSMSAA